MVISWFLFLSALPAFSSSTPSGYVPASDSSRPIAPWFGGQLSETNLSRIPTEVLRQRQSIAIPWDGSDLENNKPVGDPTCQNLWGPIAFQPQVVSTLNQYLKGRSFSRDFHPGDQAHLFTYHQMLRFFCNSVDGCGIIFDWLYNSYDRDITDSKTYNWAEWIDLSNQYTDGTSATDYNGDSTDMLKKEICETAYWLNRPGIAFVNGISSGTYWMNGRPFQAYRAESGINVFGATLYFGIVLGSPFPGVAQVLERDVSITPVSQGYVQAYYETGYSRISTHPSP